MKSSYLTIILIGVLIIGALFISGCGETATICDKPNIQIGTECCLDENDNYLCDDDDLENIAKNLGRFMENGSAGDIYDLSIPESKIYKTRQEFIELYPQIMGDRYSVVFNKAEIQGDVAYVTYDLTLGYSTYFSPANTFYKINGSWYFKGFMIVNIGCLGQEDCYEEPTHSKLISLCTQKCTNTFIDGRRLYVSEDPKQQVHCDSDYICNCICTDRVPQVATTGRNFFIEHGLHYLPIEF